jgi:hypothetical protein
MIFNANSFVRSFKSPLILPFSLFMVPPFSAFRFHRFVLSRRTVPTRWNLLSPRSYHLFSDGVDG